MRINPMRTKIKGKTERRGDQRQMSVAITPERWPEHRGSWRTAVVEPDRGAAQHPGAGQPTWHARTLGC